MTPRRAFRFILPLLAVGGAIIAIRSIDDGQTTVRDGLTFAAGDLAQALDRGSGAGVRQLIAFHDRSGALCRAFLSRDISGVACRAYDGWHLRVMRDGVALDDPGAVQRTEVALRRAAAGMAGQ